MRPEPVDKKLYEKTKNKIRKRFKGLLMPVVNWLENIKRNLPKNMETKVHTKARKNLENLQDGIKKIGEMCAKKMQMEAMQNVEGKRQRVNQKIIHIADL